MGDRRLIEEALPLREISRQSVREKNIRRGHISALHIWWARRPLVACRAAVMGSLLRFPETPEEQIKLLDFLAKFCKWEASNDSTMLNEARRLVLDHCNGKSPRVLDSFAGGGAIPLEASRVGCETYALELNPVAVLIELCTLVYLQKYGRSTDVNPQQFNLKDETTKLTSNQLASDVEKWGKWILDETEKEIERFYPPDPDGSIPLTYIWARTIKCPNPQCGAEIPLIKQLWLSNKKNKKVALKMMPDTNKKCVTFEIVQGETLDFDPKKGTIRLGSVECPVCRQGTYNKFAIKKAAREKGFGSIPLAVFIKNPKNGERLYRAFNQRDMDAFQKATEACNHFKNSEKTGTSALPNELISTDYDWVLKPPMFGLTKWADLFNPRQALALVAFAANIRKAYPIIASESGDMDYSKAITTYLALCLDRVADYCSNVCLWHNRFEMIAHTFSRQAIAIAWDYAEVNPLAKTVGGWPSMLDAIVRVIEKWSEGNISDVRQGTATRLPYLDSFFDAVIIDPPYYDAVPYSDLSDFFYVWLKRTVGSLYPELFSTPLTPKREELVQQSGKVTSAPKRKKDKNFYEAGIARALIEVNRVLKPSGICVVAFAHKTTAAWETLISALLGAGFSVTSSWPLHTEQRTRLRAHESAALASSVWLVCRKRAPEAGIGAWKNVQTQLDERVKERLNYFLNQGIKGADALLSAIGPALEIFGKYQKVEKVSGEEVQIGEFLDKVREVVAHHALTTVLAEHEIGNIDSQTAFYVLWKWTFEQEIGENSGQRTLVPFDDALKLARAVRAEIDTVLKTRLLRQEKEYVRMLGPMDRKELHMLGEVARDGTIPSIIDMIHRALILWASQEHGKLDEYLQVSGAGLNETFWRVAQALSNLLPLQSREKQLLDGLIARQPGVVSEADRDRMVRTLDEFISKEGVK